MKHIIFYDGNCALCHGFVTFVLKRDIQEYRFQFAPLGGQTHLELLDVPAPSALVRGSPETIIVRDGDGSLYSNSSAVVRVLGKLGGMWGILAALLWIIPKPIRDVGYRCIARFRYNIFGRSKAACPIVPADLRDRFLA